MTQTNKQLFDAMIARLETLELSEALHDAYFQNTTLPILKDTSIMKKFGMLSQDQLDQMNQNVDLSKENLNNATKWTQIFFGSILSRDVRLSTFLTAEPQIKQEAYYTNYKFNTYLQEDSEINVGLGSKSGNILFLKDPTETKAYVRTSKRTLFISSAVSGKYKNFISAFNTSPSPEGQKVKAFAASIVNQVKAAAIADMSRVFKSPEELQMLEAFKASPTIYAVLLDSITLALVDILNQGTYSDKYGSPFKAGNDALLASNLLSEQLTGTTSLIHSNPEAAHDIAEKLREAVQQVNPYMVDIRVLRTAFIKAKSSQNIFSGIINRCVINFTNMLSAVGQSIGSNKLDFDDLILLPQDQKAAAFLDLVKSGSKVYVATSGQSTSALRNPFIRIVSKKLDNGKNAGYSIAPDYSQGISYEIGKGGNLVITDEGYKDTAGFLLPYSAHENIVNEVIKNYGSISGNLYTNQLEELETKGETQVKSGQGGERSYKDQLLNILSNLFDPDTKTLKTGIVLLAIIPKLICQGAAVTDLLVCDEYITAGSGYALEMTFRNPEGDKDKAYADEIFTKLRPIQELYFEYMNIMLDINSTSDTIYKMESRFKNMASNMRKGIWSSPKIDGFGVFPAVDEHVRQELRISDDILMGHISETKREAIALAKKSQGLA